VSLVSQPTGGGGVEATFAWRQRLALNNSPSKVRLHPDELNLRPLASSLPKVSPSQVGVEMKLSASVIMFCKKACMQYRHTTSHSSYVVIFVSSLAALGRYPFCGVLFSPV
jgi:hypothetical protein